MALALTCSSSIFAYQTSFFTPRSDVLVNRDLLIEIFLHLLPSNRESLSKQEISQGKVQLRNLALTCKSFKDPALDCLWSCLDSLVPLIKVLPNLRIVNNTYYPCQVIPKDSKFHTYAKRVRALNLQPAPPKSSSTPSISPHLYIFIASELEGRPLFPTLQKIGMHTSADPTDEFAPLPIIFTSSVEEVSFHGQGLSNSLFGDYCVPLVRQRLTSLRCFALSSDKPDIEATTLDPVLQLTQLECLDIRLPQATKVTPDFLVKAGRTLKKLSSLTVDLHFPSHEVPFGAFPSKGGTWDSNILFPNLASVHAVSRSGGKLCGCIPAFLQEKMKSVTLVVQDNISDETYFKEVLDTLETIQCLEKVEILDQEGSRVFVGTNSIKPFLERLNLTGFKLGVQRIKYELKVQALAPLFPQSIRHTHLVRSMVLPEIIEGSYYSALSCLSYIAQHANGLQKLVVGLRAVYVARGAFWGRPGPILGPVGDLVDTWKKRSQSQSTLQILRIKELKSPLSFTTRDYNDIAQLLDLMFPRLVSIRPYSDADENEPYWKDHWWFIEHLRLMYKDLRIYRPGR